MKTTFNWLKDYVTVKVGPEELAHRLTLAGMEVKKIFPVDGESVFELEITPNRPDCLNTLGLARECSAIFNLPLKPPSAISFRKPKQACSITILDKQGCSRYIGTVIQNVSVKGSPADIQKRLLPLGLRLINNVVDITNFCILESGQPLHAFDYDRLEGRQIVVRRAKDGEKIVTIDGIERTLDPSILVIADAKKAVAIAGIMGGKDTEVTETTKNVLLESAYFDPLMIRRAARKLGLSTDASYRFERGVDFKGVATTSLRAVNLIQDLAGGVIIAFKDACPRKEKPLSSVSVNVDEISSFLGDKVTTARCQSILEHLGFKAILLKKNVLKVSPPSFRRDVTKSVDVIEEIARIVGYDQLATSIPAIKYSAVKDDKARILRQEIRRFLLAQGLNEVIGYSMTNTKSLEKTCLTMVKSVSVKNPLTIEQELMRPTLIPGLLSILLTNLSRGEKNIRNFELGKVYLPSGERHVLGILLCGVRRLDWRDSAQHKEVDFYDLKGIAEHLVKFLRIESVRYVPIQKEPFSSDSCVSLEAGGASLGFLGKISSEVLTDWDIKQKNVFVAEIDIEALCSLAKSQPNFEAIPVFPPIVRDISLSIPQEIAFEQVEKLVRDEGRGLLKQVTFIEEYRGEKIEKGFRGIVFSLMYQSPERTLREEEVTDMHEKICKKLMETFHAVRR